MYLLFCFVTGLWIVSAEMSAVYFCYCFGFEAYCVGFGHFVFTLGRVNTYSALSRLFWEFGDMEVMEFGYVTLDLDIYKVCTFLVFDFVWFV